MKKFNWVSGKMKCSGYYLQCGSVNAAVNGQVVPKRIFLRKFERSRSESMSLEASSSNETPSSSTQTTDILTRQEGIFHEKNDCWKRTFSSIVIWKNTANILWKRWYDFSDKEASQSRQRSIDETIHAKSSQCCAGGDEHQEAINDFLSLILHWKHLSMN